MLMNALAHHSARELELIRHLSLAYATATGNTGGGGGWRGSASGRAGGVGVGVGVGVGGVGGVGGGQLVDVQAVCNILHALASLNVRCLRGWVALLYSELLSGKQKRPIIKAKET
jgi:hypothetical protein